ncbi:hypothetical protein KVF89_25460 [Nocardioides carbamazepini]|uniref:hypothetical protein n=1 Tax=Nocardioides carbamazepini TaxID=2854259 RepID=UPI00214A6E94|nr:hypothetical protein [Nocardioides carbamazepini]MCR1785908.1 hypothetical protein [Nocardioides carbamazepini]
MKSPTKGRGAAALAPLLAVLALVVGFSPALVAAPAQARPFAPAAADSDDQLIARYRTMQAETGRYILDHYEPSGLGVEWKALGLARNGTPGADAWIDTYYANLADDVTAKGGVLGAATEYERVILAVTAIGGDPTDVGGHNLLAGLADQSKITLLNQRVFALIALDSKNYAIPEVAGVTMPTTRQGLVDLILGAELASGGWAFFGSIPDPDMTGMTMQALIPYRDQPEVAAALERGVAVLSDIQKPGGAYASFGESVESTVQATLALTGLGIDPAVDTRFVKGGGSAASAVADFHIDGGGFWWSTPSTIRNSMSTEQGFYGIADYLRFVDGENRLYDMTDVEPRDFGAPVVQPPPTATKAAAVVEVTQKARVKRGKRLAVTVEVSAAGVVPTGQVRVRFAGRKVIATVDAHGTATVRIKVKPRIKPGRKAVKVDYLGDSLVEPASYATGKVVKVKR